MLPYTAHDVIDAVLYGAYGPEEAKRRSLQAAIWTGPSESILGRAVGQARRLATRIVALAL